MNTKTKKFSKKYKEPDKKGRQQPSRRVKATRGVWKPGPPKGK